MRTPAAIYTELFKNIPLLAIIFLTYFGLASVRACGLSVFTGRRAEPGHLLRRLPVGDLPRGDRRRPRRPAGGRRGARPEPRRHLRARDLPAGAALGAARHQHDARRPAQVDLAAGHHLGRRADVAGPADRLRDVPRARGLPRHRGPRTSRCATRCRRPCCGSSARSAPACRCCRGAGAGCARRAACSQKEARHDRRRTGDRTTAAPRRPTRSRIEHLVEVLRRPARAQRRRPDRARAARSSSIIGSERRRQDHAAALREPARAARPRASIEVAGEPVFSGDRMVCRDLARLRQTVGMVFQRFNLFPHLTAVENVMLAQMKAARVPEHEALERAVRCCAASASAHRAHGLPGADVRRRAAARGDRPRAGAAAAVLLFDEPTSSLDPESTGEVLQGDARAGRATA